MGSANISDSNKFLHSTLCVLRISCLKHRVLLFIDLHTEEIKKIKAHKLSKYVEGQDLRAFSGKENVIAMFSQMCC